ncbi:DgyrCDS11466 [Dimorphilus gyrociliatus]|uniref:DgyrCDS11466 n=1 Tax=Dimorphilus gyrociliatus TaxID=2664684 RepID=A0A7I8W3F1_9ANNE|nr:DgyrCDS11466 [Dimorphilus gyrociliatus]
MDMHIDDINDLPQSKTEKMEDHDGFEIRGIMAVPIRNNSNRVIGIVQLLNKIDRKMFSDSDVNLVKALSIFFGLGVHNCRMYEDACTLMAKQSVALECLSYHAAASQEETDKLLQSEIPTSVDYDLYSFGFSDFNLTDYDTVKATVRMFIDCGVTKRFSVSYETGKMEKYVNDIEMFALLVACLCHDLDHRGTNNAFQSKVESPLAQLYSTSTMEHHHFDQCIMILNSDCNNIFSSLSSQEYRRVVKIIESAILSTDLALYFKKKNQFMELVNKGEQNWGEPSKRDLLRGMMMTACDVAAITKPWEIQKEVALLVAGEFFEQGDLERSRLNLEPMAMMDRTKKDDLPKMQVGFIDSICLPLYKVCI